MDEPNTRHTNFQTNGTQPPNTKAQDTARKKKVRSLARPQPQLLSDSNLRRLKIRALRLNRKAKSPRILVTISGDKVQALLDKGSKLKCMDRDFAAEKNIRLAPTSSSAVAAGNQHLNILGITEVEIIVDTLFQSHHVPINLGRMTVIQG